MDGDDDKGRDDRSPEAIADDKIMSEAKDRHKRAIAYESEFRAHYTEDVQFVHGDPDNHAQWPTLIYEQRTSDTARRPTMTANVTWPVANFIINNTRMNLPQIVIKPTGDQSTFKSAEAYEALIRHIQYRSQAPAIYIDCHSHQVWGGVAYFRVNSRYDEENPDNDAGAFDQSLFLDPVQSHMGVLLDTNIKQKSGSDAKWGMIFEDVDRDVFKRDYPGIDAPAYNALEQTDDWVREHSLRIAEYYRIVADPDELIYIEEKGENGQPATSIFRMSEAPPNMAKALKEAEKRGATIKRRKVWNKRLQWFKIAGNKIIDRNLKLPGKGNFIPIVRVVGREIVLNGKMDRKGVVRNVKDTQRLFNYYLSTDAEYNGLQPKSPYIGYRESFEGNEAQWNKLNTSNPPYLAVNMVSEEIDQPIPLPQRQPGPTDAPAYRNGMMMALQHMGIISGIPDANFGRTTNENSGLAVKERRRGGDTSNYDFADALAEAVAYAGRIMVEWIPDVYDVARTVKVMGRDGTRSEINLDPDQDQALIVKKQQEQAEGEEAIERIFFNPNVGKYEVVSEVGPSYATQREEAWDAFTAIVTRSPDLMTIFGDLMFLAADFPLSDKIAERFTRKIRNDAPWLLGEGPSPMVQKMDETIKLLQNLNNELMESLAEEKKKVADKEGELAIKAMGVQVDKQDADTREQDSVSKRITAVTNAQLDLDRTDAGHHFDKLLEQTLDMAEKTQFDPEAFGAKKAADGKHYMPDPQRPGKYLMVG